MFFTNNQIIYLTLYLAYISGIVCESKSASKPLSREQCLENIYRRCPYSQDYTKQDVENARIYVQNKFINEATFKPVKPACKKLTVRKEWKCMTEKERMDFLKAARILYKTGDIEYLANVHNNWWTDLHKTIEFVPFHVTFGLELEKRLQKINPKLFKPSWNPEFDFAAPERSIIWDYFGTSGNYSTSYCVSDGMFAKLPLVKCLRRQWNEDGTIPPWYSPEHFGVILQEHTGLFKGLIEYGVHFLPHLAIGGWYGDHSIKVAPNDIVFHLWHITHDFDYPKYALYNPAWLTPDAFNTQYRANPITGELERINFYDKVSYFSQYTELETYQVTFGDFCYIPEEIVVIIKKLLRNETSPIPTAITRLQKALPKHLFKKYYPDFAAGNTGPLFHNFPEVGNCNTECKPMPFFQPYGDTENGRRQQVEIKYKLLNNLELTTQAQQYFTDITFDLNRYGYCSPYVV